VGGGTCSGLSGAAISEITLSRDERSSDRVIDDLWYVILASMVGLDSTEKFSRTGCKVCGIQPYGLGHFGLRAAFYGRRNSSIVEVGPRRPAVYTCPRAYSHLVPIQHSRRWRRVQ
jgi:hypothetical protein